MKSLSKQGTLVSEGKTFAKCISVSMKKKLMWFVFDKIYIMIHVIEKLFYKTCSLTFHTAKVLL